MNPVFHVSPIELWKAKPYTQAKHFFKNYEVNAEYFVSTVLARPNNFQYQYKYCPAGSISTDINSNRPCMLVNKEKTNKIYSTQPSQNSNKEKPEQRFYMKRQIINGDSTHVEMKTVTASYSDTIMIQSH